MDAADHSVGNHGRTHGTGCHLVHGYVDKERKPTGFRLSFVEVTGEESQNLQFDSQNLQNHSQNLQKCVLFAISYCIDGYFFVYLHHNTVYHV